MTDQNQSTDDHLSKLIKQIIDELTCLRQDDLELTEQLTSVYDNLSQLRQSLTLTQYNSNYNSGVIPITIDSAPTNYLTTKPRSDSEPNILTNRQRMITIFDDLQ